MNIQLFNLDKTLKLFLAAYIILILAGMVSGLAYLYTTTDYTPKGTMERINGSEINVEDDFEIPEKYPKPASELFVTIHNHLLGFAAFLLPLGFIFYFNVTIKGFLKAFIMIEPMFGAIITFGSMWLIRFVHPYFAYLTIISSLLIYACFFTMAAVCLYELLIKKDKGIYV